MIRQNDSAKVAMAFLCINKRRIVVHVYIVTVAVDLIHVMNVRIIRIGKVIDSDIRENNILLYRII